MHENEDEYSFVLAGRVGAEIGDEVVSAKPGEVIAKPRGVAHAFWNSGEEARLLELISPGAFAEYFADLAPVLAVDGEPDFERATEIQASYKLMMDFGSIEPLMQRHGLEA